MIVKSRNEIEQLRMMRWVAINLVLNLSRRKRKDSHKTLNEYGVSQYLKGYKATAVSDGKIPTTNLIIVKR